jgi:hypothetical protein
MAYVKPGVEVTQVQETATPILTAPTLTACVVGEAYYWQDINLDTSVHPTTYSGATASFDLADYANGYADMDTNDGNCVIVDLISTAGSTAGQVKHLATTEFGVTASASASVAISGSLTIGGVAIGAANVKIGYRAKNTGAAGYKIHNSLKAITDTLGKDVSWNPLAYAAALCMSNSSSIVTSYDVGPDGVVDSAGTLGQLGVKDIYALAFIDDSADAAKVKTHVETMSDAINKKERLAFLNKATPWDTNNANAQTPTDLAATAAAVRDANLSINSKRVFETHPDVAYVLETRPVATLNPSFQTAAFQNVTGITWANYSAYCELASEVTTGGTKYVAGTKIDSTVFAALLADGNIGDLQVFAPVPGGYYNAACAGLLISQTPEQPLTNLSMGGIKRTLGSQDQFTEADLNTMAGGGTYVITQDGPTAPIYSRHQVSTDVTSIAYRELSVTKSLDYAAKFIRDGIKPYVGVNVISPAFIKLLNSVLVSQGLFLVREGVLNDFKVISVAQDSVSADTIQVVVNVLVKYPVNYIKIKLVF